MERINTVDAYRLFPAIFDSETRGTKERFALPLLEHARLTPVDRAKSFVMRGFIEFLL